LVSGTTGNNQGTLTVGGDERILFGFTTGGINTLNIAYTLNPESASSTPLRFWTVTARPNNAGTLNQTLAGAHAIDGSITVNNSEIGRASCRERVYASGGAEAWKKEGAAGAPRRLRSVSCRPRPGHTVRGSASPTWGAPTR